MSTNTLGIMGLLALLIFSVFLSINSVEHEDKIKKNIITCTEEGIIDEVTCSGQFGDCRFRLTNQKIIAQRYLNPLKGEKLFFCTNSVKEHFNDYYSLKDNSTLK